MGDPQKKLELLEDKLVEQVVFDVLHLKWQRFNHLNDGEHIEYKEVVEELKKRYKQQIEKQTTSTN